jgi:GNAT superfamily N-acetyltransferase
MGLIIRRARSSDAAAAADLFSRARGAAAAAGTIPPGRGSDDELKSWVARVVIPRLECWVAERPPDDIVGILVLEDDWIDQLYVDPDATRAGIGTELLDLAKHQRPNGLRLWTFVSNRDAQRFYLRHGFREVERTDGSRNVERAPDIQYAWQPT